MDRTRNNKKVKEIEITENCAHLPALIPEPSYSESASLYLGKRVPANTKKNNKRSIRAFARFIVGPKVSGDFETEPQLHSLILISNKLRADEAVNKLNRKLFNNVPPNQAVSTDIRKQIRQALIEFVVNYHKKGEENESISPETTIGYMRGIFRTIEAWGYSMGLLKHPVFTDKK